MPTETPKTAWDLAVVAVPAVSALAGVLVGGLIQTLTAFVLARKQRSERIEDAAAERNHQEMRVEAQRASARLKLALHLEGFAKACASVVSDNNDPDIKHAAGLVEFPAWPDIDWNLLGPAETARARDIEMRVALRSSFVQGDVIYGAFNLEEAQAFYSAGAAAIGLEAWAMAEKLRREASVAPFAWPPEFEGWNYVDTMRSEKARAEARSAAQAASIDELNTSLTAAK